VRRAGCGTGLPIVASLVVLAALGCRGGDREHAQAIAIPPAPPPAPAPVHIAACESLADTLRRGADLDVDPEVRALLADQGALLHSALRGATAADRDELTARCATGLLDLARVPSTSPHAGYDLSGGVAGGVVGGLTGAPSPPAPPVSGLTPACQRLVDLFDRMASCPDVSVAMQDQIRQARSIMFNGYSQLPQDVRASMEDSCRTAAAAYDQVVSSFHCP
jgi:hypothetical protein